VDSLSFSSFFLELFLVDFELIRARGFSRATSSLFSKSRSYWLVEEILVPSFGEAATTGRRAGKGRGEELAAELMGT